MAVMCLGVTERGQLASGSVDHTVRLWDLAAGKLVHTLQGHSRSVHCLCTHALDAGSPFGQGSEVVISGSRDHSIKVCARMRARGPARQAAPTLAPRGRLTFTRPAPGPSPAGPTPHLARAPRQVWDLRTNKMCAELLGHSGSVTCLGTYQWQLASGGGFNRGMDDDTILSVDSTLRMWDLRKMRCMWVKDMPPPPGGTAHPKGDPVLSLQLLHDKIITSHGGKDWTARVWTVMPDDPREALGAEPWRNQSG